MSYHSTLDELNKNLELYLQNKCDPAVSNLSKALYQLTLAIEQDMKEQMRQIKSLKALVEQSNKPRRPA